jgi:hypothetical protein
MSNANDTIFREVDEELRGDRLRAFWRRFGPYVIGAAVAVVVIVAANEGWNWWQNSSSARSSDQFYAALEQAEAGDVAGAQSALNDIAAQGTGGYPTLARYRQASLLARDGKRDEAIAAYDALATSETNPRLRELALVLAAFLAVDSGDVAAVQQRVGSVASPENPLRNAAREAIGLTQYKAGDLDAALVTLELILNDPAASQEVRQRVQVYVAQLVALGAGPEDAAAAAPAAEPAPAAEAAPVTEVPAEPSVGDAPAMDVVEPATDAAPATEAPAAEAPASN